MSDVTLGGVTFDFDPATTRRQRPLLGSVHVGLGGAVTVQDFGRQIEGTSIELESGTQYMTRETVAAIDALLADQGQTYQFLDWEGNRFEVWIEEWEPSPAFADLYTYRLRLRVLDVTLLHGTAY
jgi:hypothetical protein